MKIQTPLEEDNGENNEKVMRECLVLLQEIISMKIKKGLSPLEDLDINYLYHLKEMEDNSEELRVNYLLAYQQYLKLRWFLFMNSGFYFARILHDKGENLFSEWAKEVQK